MRACSLRKMILGTVLMGLILVAGTFSAVQPNIKKEIVDTTAAAGSFQTLAAGAQAAGLTDTLKSKGPFTVFAPTNEAFAKLSAGTVDDLLKPENERRLEAILSYQVVARKETSKEIVNLHSDKTVSGQSAAIRVKDHRVMINNAKLIKANVESSNGVIHVIDTVLLPQ